MAVLHACHAVARGADLSVLLLHLRRELAPQDSRGDGVVGVRRSRKVGFERVDEEVDNNGGGGGGGGGAGAAATKRSTRWKLPKNAHIHAHARVATRARVPAERGIDEESVKSRRFQPFEFPRTFSAEHQRSRVRPRCNTERRLMTIVF